jgi:hypothetical protein
MYTHWLNGNLVLEPETADERRALLLLWENAKQGPPEDQRQVNGSGTGVFSEQLVHGIATGQEVPPS